MTLEKCQQSWKDQLIVMGFPASDVERADRAGVRDVASALDFITSALTTESADKTDTNYTPLASSTRQNAPTFNADSHHTTSLSNARNSLDHTDVARVSSATLDAFSTQQPLITPDTVTPPSQPQHPPPTIQNTSQQSKPTEVQQTQTHDDDLTRALELSRKEQDERDITEALKMSKETEATTPYADRDPEFIRAIEESIKENQRFTHDRSVSWQSQAYQNTTDGRRENLDDPVGLRNIGNTCYLNSLLQVYYHLPDFRRAILSFRPTLSLDGSTDADDITNPSLQLNENEKIAPDGSAERKSETTSDCAAPVAASVAPAQPDVIMSIGEVGAAAPPSPSGKANASRGATSVSDKSDNRSERAGGDRNDRASKRHAVEFVIELQRLFAAMALGNLSCIDPTAVARAMRDGEGNPIKIGDQQDASEFNHLFLDIVERGLRGDDDDGDMNHCRADSHTVSNALQPSLPRECQGDEAMGEREEATGANEKPVNVVKDMFTVKFRQEVRICGAEVENASPVDPAAMVTGGETNCIIVDATTSKERDLYSGLEDYTVAQIECIASRTGGSVGGDADTVQNQNVSNEVTKSTALKETLEGGEHIATATSSTRGNEDGDEVMASNAMSDVGIAEAPASPSMLKSVWFTKLPPVVVIYLQRVRFIREKSVAEKVHDKYDFGTEIALDRYLEENRDASARARNQVEGIRKERRRLLAMVKRYRNFPTGGRDVGDEESTSDCDTVMKDEGELFSAGERIRKRLKEAVNPSSGNLFGVDDVSKEQVDYAIGTINRILDHDHERCEGYEQELGSLENETDVYRGLDKVKYRLHAVLVHDGAPSGGHYWTFIRDWRATTETETKLVDDGTRDNVDATRELSRWTWLKFSDSIVSRVKEDDMLLWSAGGHGRASAYCLIYTAASSVHPPGSDTDCLSIAEESRQLLPTMRLEEVDRNRAESNKVTEEVATVTNDNDDVKTSIDPNEPVLKNQSWYT